MPGSEQPPEILMDPDRNDRFRDLGSFALKEALTKHLAAAYPDAAPALLAALRDANLSRHNLTRVADHLESKGKIYVMKVKQNGQDYVKEDGLRIALDSYNIGVAGHDVTSDTHKQWENIARELRGVKGNRYPIKRVPMKDLGKGFRAAAADYALQSAGLVYVESKYDVNNFWEVYKEHMEPIIGPEDLENQHKAARAFQTEMKYVIEAVPRYFSFMLKDP